MKRSTLLIFVFAAHCLFAYEWYDVETGITWNFGYYFEKEGCGAAWRTGGELDLTKPDENGNVFRGIALGGPKSEISGEVRVPATINGYPVIRIFDWLWDIQKNTELILPEGIEVIEGWTFHSCVGLKSIVLPSTLKEIGDVAFVGSGITSIHIPNGVKRILDSTFNSCSSLRSISIPESVVEIGDAFNDCPALGDGIIIRDGCVLCINGKCPANVVLPQGTRLIAGDAFRNCQELKTISIPEGVQHVGREAFLSCVSLKTLTLPSTLIQLGGSTFNGCVNLKTVYYRSEMPPEIDEDDCVYGGTPGNLVSYAPWKDMGDVWSFRALKYWAAPDSGGNETQGFDGSAAQTFNGLVYDSGVMCGMVQITTAKATAKGVKVSGSVILDDGKKQTIKTVTAQVSGGYLKVSTTVGKLGTLDMTIGGNGFLGTLGDMTVATADVDESTGIMSATVKVQYFDAKTGKIKTKSYKLTGITSGGDAVGNVSLKNDVKTFEAVIE